MITRVKRILLGLGIVAALPLTFPLPVSHAQDTASEPAQEVIHVHAIQAMPPFVIEGEGSRIVGGRLIEMMDEIANRAGFQLRHFLAPYPRVLRMLESGDSDILAAVDPAEPAADFLILSNPLAVLQGLLIFNAQSHPDFSWTRIDDLSGKSVCGVNGLTYEGFPHRLKQAGGNYLVSRSLIRCLRMVAENRADFAIADDVAYWTIIPEQNTWIERLQPAGKPIYQAPRHIGIAPTSPLRDKLPAINQAIEELKQEGYLSVIAGKSGEGA